MNDALFLRPLVVDTGLHTKDGGGKSDDYIEASEIEKSSIRRGDVHGQLKLVELRDRRERRWASGSTRRFP